MMTKKTIVDEISSANAELVLAFLSPKAPFLEIGIVRYIVKYFLMKWLRPTVNAGVVFTAFEVIDWQQVEKAKAYDQAKKQLLESIEQGVPDEKSDIEFDKKFRDAIRLNKP